MSKERFKKRIPEPAAFVADHSIRLGRISNLINQANFSQALELINAGLAADKTPRLQAKLLGQVARTLHKRGKFAEAAETLGKASKIAQSEARDWFPPARSRIRSLLKNVSLVEAEEEARVCLSAAEAKFAEFTRLKAAAGREFLRTGRVVVPLKPHRPSVIASELGELFLLEGELKPAKWLFEKAIEGNPRGGTRARQGLAEIALRMDDAETAFQRSVEALTLGKFQGKTIASWKPFFAARRKLGYTGLSPEFVASLRSARPSVRARSWLVVVRELRSANDSQWKPLAEEWLAGDGVQFPAVAAEMRKLLMAATRLAEKDPAAQIEAARQLLGTPNLAPHEWLSGAKELVRATFFAKRDPGISRLITEGVTRYGNGFKGQLCHSLALSCMMANKHDLARPLLREAIAVSASPRNHIWSKAFWALGRMERFLGHHAAAAKAFGEVARAPQVPERFRLQARMLWAENMLADGDEEALQACAKELPDMLAGVQDYSTLLDFARQLSISKGELRTVANKVFSMGEEAALKAFSSATHPSQAIDILFRLTRRQVYDFGRSAKALAFWKALPESKKLWLWNDDNRWWGYLAFLLIAHLRTDDLRGAADFAKAALEDPATPRTALPAILVPYYEELVRVGRAAEALEAFRWIVTENPTRAGCAAAYYWLALDAHRRGDSGAVRQFTENLLISNAHTEVTFDKWMFEAKARLLQSNLDPSKVTVQAVKFDLSYLESAKKNITYHLGLL